MYYAYIFLYVLVYSLFFFLKEKNTSMQLSHHIDSPPDDTNIPKHISRKLYHKLLWDYIYENGWLMIAFCVVILFTLPVEMVVLPRFYSSLFETLRSTSNSKLPELFTQPVENLFGQTATGVIYTISIIWLVVVCAYLLKNTMEAYIVPSYTSFVRQRMFKGTIDKHADDYKDIRVGEHVTRMMDVSRNMKDVLTITLNDVLPIYLAVISLCVYLCVTNRYIGLVATGGVLLHTLVMVCCVPTNITISAHREKYYLELSEKLHDSFGNLMNVYINNMKTEEISNNNTSEAAHKDLLNAQFVNIRNIIVVLSLVTILTFVSTICVTYNEMRLGSIGSTTFVSIWIIILLYLSNMMRLSDLIPHLTSKLGIIKCSNDFLMSILDDTTERSNEHQITNGDVKFDNVTFAYDGSSSPTLYKFNLHVKAGEKVAVIGTSGSGKTTSMKLLNGMHKPQEGELTIDGHDVTQISLQHLRSQVNYINQRTYLFNTSIVKNIQYGNDTPADEVTAILQEYQLDAVYSKLKEGINTNAGVHGASLSLGMQKVTMLMRGLMRGGQIIVMDEPLAGLDAKTREKVMRFVADYTRDKTLIVITHDKEILPMMDRVVSFGDINQTKPNIIEQLTNYLTL